MRSPRQRATQQLHKQNKVSYSSSSSLNQNNKKVILLQYDLLSSYKFRCEKLQNKYKITHITLEQDYYKCHSRSQHSTRKLAVSTIKIRKQNKRTLSTAQQC